MDAKIKDSLMDSDIFNYLYIFTQCEQNGLYNKDIIFYQILFNLYFVKKTFNLVGSVNHCFFNCIKNKLC